ncbi:MAG: hypothetical protein ACI8PT_004443 [Gammaproteobacteria bacterium]|jgi:hypothetical protein
MKQWSALKNFSLQPPDFSLVAPHELETMRAAGAEVTECYRVLDKGEINIVSELLKDQGTFFEDDHYPDGDVFDEETASQYYYHAHRGIPGEHGHFHTFLRADAIPGDISAAPYDGDEPWPEGGDCIAHLVAVSMDRSGLPLGFFMTNRWVTGETWYVADDMSRLLPSFSIDHAFPSWPANRWLSAIIALFAPQLRSLLAHRDAVVGAWAQAHPELDVYEDRDLEITGWLRVSVDEQLTEIAARQA